MAGHRPGHFVLRATRGVTVTNHSKENYAGIVVSGFLAEAIK
jgi:hypothetical protein